MKNLNLEINRWLSENNLIIFKNQLEFIFISKNDVDKLEKYKNLGFKVEQKLAKRISLFINENEDFKYWFIKKIKNENNDELFINYLESVYLFKESIEKNNDILKNLTKNKNTLKVLINFNKKNNSYLENIFSLMSDSLIFNNTLDYKNKYNLQKIKTPQDMIFEIIKDNSIEALDLFLENKLDKKYRFVDQIIKNKKIENYYFIKQYLEKNPKDNLIKLDLINSLDIKEMKFNFNVEDIAFNKTRGTACSQSTYINIFEYLMSSLNKFKIENFEIYKFEIKDNEIKIQVPSYINNDIVEKVLINAIEVINSMEIYAKEEKKEEFLSKLSYKLKSDFLNEKINEKISEKQIINKINKI